MYHKANFKLSTNITYYIKAEFYYHRNQSVALLFTVYHK